MKVKQLILTILSLSLLAGCTKDNNTVTAPEGNPETGLNCFTLCHETVPALCEDTIVEMEANGINVMTGDTIYNDTFCEAQCMGWTAEIMECVSKAESCDQLGPEAEYCITNEPKDPFVYDEEKDETAGNCNAACNNYAGCAGFAEDATPADLDEAYNTCMGECANWDQENISCMANATVSPQGCMNISLCGLRQYQGMMQ